MRLFHALNKAGIPFKTQIYIKTKHRDYLVDFLVSPNIIVEVDGKSHDLEMRQMKDALKDQHLTELGYTVIRFKDQEIKKNVNSAIEIIRKLVGEP
jgi:very-short-patch-repair endonuclease